MAAEVSYGDVAGIHIGVGVLSLIGGAVILAMFEWDRRLASDQLGKMIWYMTVCDVLYTLKFFVSAVVWEVGLRNDRSSFHLIPDDCFTSAAYGMFLSMAIISWNACWVIDLLVTLSRPLASTRKNLPWYHIFVWGTSTGAAIYIMATEEHQNTQSHTCWIRADSVNSSFFDDFLYVYIALAAVSIILAIRAACFAGTRLTRALRRQILARHILYVLVFVAMWVWPIAHRDAQGATWLTMVDAFTLSGQALVLAVVRLSEPGAAWACWEMLKACAEATLYFARLGRCPFGGCRCWCIRWRCACCEGHEHLEDEEEDGEATLSAPQLIAGKPKAASVLAMEFARAKHSQRVKLADEVARTVRGTGDSGWRSTKSRRPAHLFTDMLSPGSGRVKLSRDSSTGLSLRVLGPVVEGSSSMEAPLTETESFPSDDDDDSSSDSDWRSRGPPGRVHWPGVLGLSLDELLPSGAEGADRGEEEGGEEVVAVQKAMTLISKGGLEAWRTGQFSTVRRASELQVRAGDLLVPAGSASAKAASAAAAAAVVSARSDSDMAARLPLLISRATKKMGYGSFDSAKPVVTDTRSDRSSSSVHAAMLEDRTGRVSTERATHGARRMMGAVPLARAPVGEEVSARDWMVWPRPSRAASVPQSAGSLALAVEDADSPTPVKVVTTRRPLVRSALVRLRSNSAGEWIPGAENHYLSRLLEGMSHKEEEEGTSLLVPSALTALVDSSAHPTLSGSWVLAGEASETRDASKRGAPSAVDKARPPEEDATLRPITSESSHAARVSADSDHRGWDVAADLRKELGMCVLSGLCQSMLQSELDWGVGKAAVGRRKLAHDEAPRVAIHPTRVTSLESPSGTAVRVPHASARHRGSASGDVSLQGPLTPTPLLPLNQLLTLPTTSKRKIRLLDGFSQEAFQRKARKLALRAAVPVPELPVRPASMTVLPVSKRSRPNPARQSIPEAMLQGLIERRRSSARYIPPPGMLRRVSLRGDPPMPLVAPGSSSPPDEDGDVEEADEESASDEEDAKSAATSGSGTAHGAKEEDLDELPALPVQVRVPAGDASTPLLPAKPARRSGPMSSMFQVPSRRKSRRRSSAMDEFEVFSLHDARFSALRADLGLTGAQLARCFDPLLLASGKLRAHFSEGASRAFFCRSENEDLIIKTISKDEVEALHRVLPSYNEHLRQNPDSFLCRFLALLVVRVRGIGELYCLLMQNVFPFGGMGGESFTFDLKGSTVGRRSRPTESLLSKDEHGRLVRKGQLHLDQDFRDMLPRGIPIADEALRSSVLGQLMRDITLLSTHGLMDYSFLVTVTPVPLGHTAELAAGHIAPLTREMDSSLPKRWSAFSAQVTELPVWRPFDEGGPEMHSVQAIVQLGIVDLLQQYDLGKKLESGFKRVIRVGRSADISAVPTEAYARRFVSFFDDVLSGEGIGLETN
jgi:hypothetical protein